MKRVYKNNDIIFGLTINNFTFNPEFITDVEFKFYTLNSNNFIRKTKADIKDSSIVLEWNELSKLEQGILNYSYNIAEPDGTFKDHNKNSVDNVMTNYFIMSGKDGIDVEQQRAKWGLIEGSIVDLKDLIEYINVEVKKIDDTFAKKIELPTKVSQLSNDKGYLTTHQPLTNYYTKQEIENKKYLTQHQDITGKVDKSTYNADNAKLNSELGNKANKTELPTKVSQLTNDSGYINKHQDISGKVDKVTYSNDKQQIGKDIQNLDNRFTTKSAEVDASLVSKADKTELPTKVSELINDKGFIVQADIVDEVNKAVNTLLGVVDTMLDEINGEII